MMYSQQEYDMVRRQTMQIEAEKRAVLRFALMGVSVLFALSLLVLGWIYQRYSSGEGRVRTAQEKAATLEADLTKVRAELQEKTALLEKDAATQARINATVESVVPKIFSKQARENEVAELAHAIFQQPGHVITLPSIPPDNILRRYRLRIDGRPYSYVLVAGLVSGKWVLYSNLVKNQED